MSARGINISMIFLTIVIIVITGLIICGDTPDSPGMSEAIRQTNMEAPKLFSLAELTLIKNTKSALSDKWEVGAEPPSDAVLIEAPAASSALKLVGTLTHNHCQYAIAVIEIGGVQRSYGCTDILENDHEQIVRVFPGKVIINNNGYYESLQVSKD